MRFLVAFTFSALRIRPRVATLAKSIIGILVAAAAIPLTLRAAFLAIIVHGIVSGDSVISEVISGEFIVVIFSFIVLILVNIHGVLDEASVAVVIHLAVSIFVMLISRRFLGCDLVRLCCVVGLKRVIILVFFAGVIELKVVVNFQLFRLRSRWIETVIVLNFLFLRTSFVFR